MTMTTWRKEILAAMEVRGETMTDVVASAPPLGVWLDVRFDSSYGSSEGEPFTIWTAATVYFPAVYDGSEWCACVSRNPDGLPTAHVGGQ